MFSFVRQQIRLTKSHVDDPVEGCREGQSARQHCQTWHIGKEELDHTCAVHGSPHLRTFGLSKVARARVHYDSSLTLVAVRERLGLDVSTLPRHFVTGGVPIRPRRVWLPT